MFQQSAPELAQSSESLQKRGTRQEKRGSSSIVSFQEELHT